MEKQLDKRKMNALRMSERGVSPQELRGGMFSETLEGIADLKKEFQEEYCPLCVKYDPKNKAFLEVKDNACKWHYIDVLGQCWNYKKRVD